MDFRQLELTLDEFFEEAAEAPAIADLRAAWQQFEPILTNLALPDRLRLGSQIIDQLAGLYQVKAQWLLDEWEHTHDPQDPNMASDWLQGLVRQTQQVDLSELTAPVKRRPRKPSSKNTSSEETLVGEVPKENIMKMLDQVEQEQQKAEVLAVAHEESIQAWVTELSQWFVHHPEPILLLQLRQQLGWPLVKLWLSLLLGGFQLEADEHHFYSLRIRVSVGGMGVLERLENPS